VAFGSGVKEEAIAERTEINFYFKIKSVESEAPAAKEKSDGDVVNTGYNKVERKNLTTSISKVDGAKSKRSYSTIYEMLQTVPGVKVTGRSVIVQDSRNLQGSVEPLFVVDGIPVSSIDDIMPATVESIEVLKGTAAAIYGTRAFGGAILIKRKAL
jgi:outer membrane receptor for ferrienterochelin and colicin